MLIAADGHYAGLLSGGCLEQDLAQHAAAVIETGVPRAVRYDLRHSDDLIWGLGLGCEGAMQILLLRVGPREAWEPLSHLAESLAAHRPTAVGIVTESERDDLPVGTVFLPPVLNGADAVDPLPDPRARKVLEQAARSGRVDWFEAAAPRWRLFALPLSLPPKLLLLGAGPDAGPVVDFAARLSWKVTVADHRPAYADPEHFPGAERVVLTRPQELIGSQESVSTVDPMRYTAAVVMSHHLSSDLEYLRSLARTSIPYIGLLGPPVRREKLLSDLGVEARKLRGRLRAPVGLALGGRTPESIALAIIAEIHAFVYDTHERS